VIIKFLVPNLQELVALLKVDQALKKSGGARQDWGGLYSALEVVMGNMGV